MLYHFSSKFVKIHQIFLFRNTAVPQGLGGIFILTRWNGQKMEKRWWSA